MYKLLKRILVYALCLFPFLGHSQQSDIVFEQITNQSGRSLGFITGIVQDETGFMWFATRKGLYRYNGYSYKFFTHNSNDTTTIPFNNITYLYNDNAQNLWVKHYNELGSFKDEEKVFTFDSITQKNYDIEVQVIQDKYNNYWVGPTGNGLMMYNDETKTVRNFSFPHRTYKPETWDFYNMLIDSIAPIAQIVNPGNNSDTLVAFDVKKAGYYLIASSGEIDKYGRYDFGSLYANNKLVWELSKDKSMWSGADGKNKFEAIALYLEPGNFQLKFKSDLSHCCEKWDGDAPDKIDFCGVSVIPIDSKLHKEIQRSHLKVDKDNNYIASNLIKDLLIDNEGKLWALTDKGLEKYNYKRGMFESHPIDFEGVFGMSMEKEYLSVFQDNDGIFWIGSMHGLLQHDHLWGRNLLFQNTADAQVLTSNAIYSVFEDYEGRMWIGTDKGINIYDRERNTVEKITADNKNRLYDNRILQIFEDDSKNIWVATVEGLNRLIKNGFTYTDLAFEADDVFPASYDGSANIWYALKNKVFTYSRTLTTQKEYQLPDRLFRRDDFTEEINYQIADMAITPDRHVWVATDNKVSRLNILTKTVDFTYETNALIINKDSLRNRINLISVGKSNEIYAFSPKGIHTVNYSHTDKQAFYPFEHKIDFIDELDMNYVKTVIKDRKGTYWVRTSAGIYHFSPQLKKLKLVFEFDYSVMGGPLSAGRMDLDKYGDIWFAALPNLFKVNTETFAVDTFKCEFEHDWGMSNVKIGKAEIWIYGANGVYGFNLTDSSFNYISIDNGLVDNGINGVFEDSLGYIWFTSLKGLTKYNLQDNQCLNFFTSSDFTTHRFLGQPENFTVPTNEEVLFSTTGFLSFYPDSINRHIPKVVIDRFTLRGKDFELDSLIYKKNIVKLKYNQNLIGFEFSVLDFTAPSLNSFKYKLEGLEDEWNIGDSHTRKPQYTGLAPGKYIFRVQGANNDKVWNEEGVSIFIEITPPWYKTILAYIIYVLLIGSAVWIFIKQRERKLIEEKRILEDKVTERTAEIEAQKEELSTQNEKIAEQHKNITDSIHYAQRIQAAILPSVYQIENQVDELFVLYRPRDIVSGDYYWATRKGSISIIVAADCTGHGVPGAFMSMLGVAFLNEIVNKEGITEPNLILDRLRKQVILQLHQTGGDGESKDGMDLSLYVIDHETNILKFSGAYNPLYVIRDNEMMQLKADRMPIGYHIKMEKDFSCEELQLQKGDCLYNSSDGYPDQFGGPNERKFMTKNFKKLLLDIHKKPMSEQHTILDKTIDEWRGPVEQIDDIIVIGIRI